MSGKQDKALRREAAAREAHMKLVYERQGDPRFVQRTTDEDGVRIQLTDGQSDEFRAGFESQKVAFREKFGREMGPDDPLMFDSDADEPIPLSREKWERNIEEMVTRAEDIGVDPAFLLAWRDLGYIVTEQNQHTFSAAEVQAYGDAVERHRQETANG
jgi:hypothetical protein